MTWLEVLRGRPVVSSIFLWMSGDGTQNDNMLHFLEKLENDNASINDLFLRQRQLTRAEIIAILEARIRRRLA